MAKRFREVVALFCEGYEGWSFTPYPVNVTPISGVHHQYGQYRKFGKPLSVKQSNWLSSTGAGEFYQGSWRGVVGDLGVTVQLHQKGTGHLTVYSMSELESAEKAAIADLLRSYEELRETLIECGQATDNIDSKISQLMEMVFVKKEDRKRIAQKICSRLQPSSDGHSRRVDRSPAQETGTKGG